MWICLCCLSLPATSALLLMKTLSRWRLQAEMATRTSACSATRAAACFAVTAVLQRTMCAASARQHALCPMENGCAPSAALVGEVSADYPIRFQGSLFLLFQKGQLQSWMDADGNCPCPNLSVGSAGTILSICIAFEQWKKLCWASNHQQPTFQGLPATAGASRELLVKKGGRTVQSKGKTHTVLRQEQVSLQPGSLLS